LAAESEIDFGVGRIRVAENHKISGRFPESEKFVRATFFAKVEQSLVARQIFSRGRQSQIAVFHSGQKSLTQKSQRDLKRNST
jgi:hypothetical protein